MKGKALSFVTRPDGSTLGIWKNALVATTADRGHTWTTKEFAANLPNNASKYWLQRTSEGHYALVFNPTNRLRHPLALTLSDDGEHFSNLLAVHGELPEQRFGGAYKNLGPQYVRGIVEGNGTPPDADRAFRLAYSVNKEDLWVARVPTPIRATVDTAVHDDFGPAAPGTLPSEWNIYSPAWAPVRVVDTADSGHALELRDEDPYDYARAVRVFPATHGVRISLRVRPHQTNARLELDLLDAHGARPVRLAFAEDGFLWACHEGQWWKAAEYVADRWQTLVLEIPSNPKADRCAVMLDGETTLSRPAIFTDPVQTVERLSLRTACIGIAVTADATCPAPTRRCPPPFFSSTTSSSHRSRERPNPPPCCSDSSPCSVARSRWVPPLTSIFLRTPARVFVTRPSVCRAT